jgi:hypothetical protein
MSLKLREMVRGIRACKTVGDIKDLVQSEKAAIRESFTVTLFNESLVLFLSRQKKMTSEQGMWRSFSSLI